MRLIRWSRRTALLALAAICVLALGTGIAVSQTNGPRTDRVFAEFELNRTQVQTRNCQGNDGAYTEQHATYEGESGGDPRLTGDLTVRVDSLVNQADPDNGGRISGTAEGHFRIQRDDGTSTTGNFSATVTGQLVGTSVVARTEGTTVAHVRGPAHEVGGKLIDSFTFTSDRFGQAGVGEFGGVDDDPEQPAYIQTESCTGPAQPGP